jgi:hypothetical protein
MLTGAAVPFDSCDGSGEDVLPGTAMAAETTDDERLDFR